MNPGKAGALHQRSGRHSGTTGANADEKQLEANLKVFSEWVFTNNALASSWLEQNLSSQNFQHS